MFLLEGVNGIYKSTKRFLPNFTFKPNLFMKQRHSKRTIVRKSFVAPYTFLLVYYSDVREPFKNVLADFVR